MYQIKKNIILIILAIPFFIVTANAVESAPADPALVRLTADSLWRLKQSIINDGFFNSRVALNIWKNRARDTGTFDQAEYEELKKQIYEKSIDDSLRGYKLFLMEGNRTDAGICLKIWKMHSKEIGVFDKVVYDDFFKNLKKNGKKVKPKKIKIKKVKVKRGKKKMSKKPATQQADE